MSVVICAYTTRRWDQLQAAVCSVERQIPLVQHGDDAGPGRALEVEVIVVIDHASDLYEMCVDRWPQHLVLQNEAARGLSGARNTGIAAARGEVIAFMDDDARAEPDWLSTLIGHFSEPGVGGAGGLVLPAWDRRPSWLPEEFRWVVGCSYRGQPETVADVRNPIGANMAFRRSMFLIHGGFADGLGRLGTLPLGCEETEFSIRVRAGGSRIVYEPGAVVHHAVPAERCTILYFLRRCWSEGRSKAAVARLAGRHDALASERAYVARTLPRGLARAVRDAIGGPRRRSAVARGVAIVAGTLVTGAGYLRG